MRGRDDGMKEIRVSTGSRTELVDITSEVQKAVRESGVRDGVCHVYVPHTTAGVTINENADPSVRQDILKELNKIVPFEDNYGHLEGNAAAHIKASLVGGSETILVEGGRLLLGTWQGVFFCEFDGPRSRRVLFSIS
jgi:secondary thiamine-phosphate synthase enzyme